MRLRGYEKHTEMIQKQKMYDMRGTNRRTEEERYVKKCSSNQKRCPLRYED